MFIIRNSSPEVINIQRREADFNITLPRVDNFDIKQKRHGIFVSLYATNTKQDWEGKDQQTQQISVKTQVLFVKTEIRHI